MESVRIFDPVAGGEALVVLEWVVGALEVYGPGDGRAAACVRVGKEGAGLRSGCGRRALLELDIGCYGEGAGGLQGTSGRRRGSACGSGRCASSTRFLAATRCSCSTWVLRLYALVAFEDLSTGARGSRVVVFVQRCVSSTLVAAARRWSCSRHTGLSNALTAFTDPAPGEPRLVSGSDDVRVWNPAASGAAIEAEPEGHSDDVNALVGFVDPATGALRSRPGPGMGRSRVQDARLAVRCS